MIIDKNLCVGCGHCVPFCPKDAIGVFGWATIDKDKCKECKICMMYCPNCAILEEMV
ncbi:MAG: 4Fe-4S binding protein [Candidatus Hydrothermarchaeales archaeon]